MGGVDLTSEFRAAIKQHRKAKGTTTPASELLPAIKPKSAWLSESHAVVNDIRKLRQFLQEHVSDYINVERFLSTPSTRAMTESHRDEIDNEALLLVKACNDRIQRLERTAAASVPDTSSMMRSHLDSVVSCLYEQVKELASLLQHLRKIRVKQAKQTVKRLSSEVRRSQKKKSAVASPSPHATGPPTMSALSWLSEDVVDDFNTTGQDEALMFEHENQALAAQLDANANAARELEKKLTEISEMVAFFSTKIHEQNIAIEQSHENAVMAHEQVTKGNDQLAMASEQSFLGRFSVLLFLIIASAALLFLDWYS